MNLFYFMYCKLKQQLNNKYHIYNVGDVAVILDSNIQYAYYFQFNSFLFV